MNQIRVRPTVREALASQVCLTSSESPQLDCQILLGHVLQQSRTWLMAHDDYQLADQEAEVFIKLVNERSKGNPIAYIIGRQEFWSMEFQVNDATLIPRPDTELLVETILDRCNRNTATVVDLGTGAGPIAIALARERPDYTIFATDKTYDTLNVAQQNGRQLQHPNLFFVQADWLTTFKNGVFDIIVSNPPYIEPGDMHLDQLGFEPTCALISDENGLKDIRLIVSTAADYLKPGGMILLEHGYNQQTQVIDLLHTNDFCNVEPLMDLAGQPRAVLAYKNCN
ncbi:MAG TPA: peptide chain release factor N(5)-glutamine methyltransferase [Pseudomonadales bacterium]|jgi:release factor glutamine methyltransferase|nr:protein-(glutamine-N5) methyltransferase, release factor-specific [Gammaproteobacteria bacterium]MDP6024768.1 peptide chain release factor N(5)-glutamine methyltransferase [Pseudomonadales bacterium]MDP6317338.1 peptide chain release factor N(5)-glutamine methyltransferase [Pseudomonadales bacterium]MDP7314465.1 peptide chain release factor N(5)-glutamine methyltransferase [Pseudomonadales bacterium]MDP7575574.1 peptide chain release factor N(5)-glutamine methyltransferase [Pseudomonadales b|tara:strand:+ start:166 stop:1014 length:849 start_codon:yes stop_codon:yes gene_type:complete